MSALHHLQLVKSYIPAHSLRSCPLRSTAMFSGAEQHPPVAASDGASRYTFRSLFALVMRTSTGPPGQLVLLISIGLPTIETCTFQVLLILLDLTCSSDASDVKCHAVSDVFRKGLLGQDIGYGDSPSGFEQTVHFIECFLFLIVRYQIYDAVGDDAVGDAVFQGYIGYARLNEFYVIHRSICLELPGFGEHALLRVRHGSCKLIMMLTLFMSTPIDFPVRPTFLEERKTSSPAPLPRSITVSP